MWSTDQVDLSALRARRSPKLDITFDPAQGRPYVQDRKTVAGQDHFVIQQQIRVGIRNLSDELVTAAHVILESCEPLSDYVYPGHALRQQGPQGEFFDVNPGDGPTVYVDVLVCLMSLPTWESNNPTEVEDLHICYVENLMSRLPVRDHTLVLRVEGGGTFQRRRFRASIVGPRLEFIRLGDG
jgi:hypothetical protein